MKQILLALTSLIFTTAAFAGDASTFAKLGFSKDGRYFAFAQYGIQDGSGFSYAEVGIVEVAKNTFVSLVKERPQDEDGNVKNTLATAIKKAPLAKYGIRAGKNLGEDLVVRLPNDRSSFSDVVFTTYRNAEGGAVPESPQYSLKITEKDAGHNDFCNMENKMIRLNLDSVFDDQPLHIVLQDDQVQPKSRECSYAYGITRVTKLGDAFVTVLEYSSDGFEGPDYRSMVVTGNVKFP